jgi:hypothetical protein
MLKIFAFFLIKNNLRYLRNLKNYSLEPHNDSLSIYPRGMDIKNLKSLNIKRNSLNELNENNLYEHRIHSANDTQLLSLKTAEKNNFENERKKKHFSIFYRQSCANKHVRLINVLITSL